MKVQGRMTAGDGEQGEDFEMEYELTRGHISVMFALLLYKSACMC